MTKKYLLFAGSQYYPEGGASDFIGFYDTIQDAQIARPEDIDWAHIAGVDGETLVIRYEYETATYGGEAKWVAVI